MTSAAKSRSVPSGRWWPLRKRAPVSLVYGSSYQTGTSISRVFSTGWEVLSTSTSISRMAASSSAAPSTSGSKRTSRDALAGQISVTPASARPPSLVAIELDLKFAARLIASEISTKRNSSPPQV